MNSHIGGDGHAADQDHGRLVDGPEDEQVEDREQEAPDGHDKAEEQEGDLGLRAAKPCHGQPLPGIVRAEPFAELELLDHLLHIGLGLPPQRDGRFLGEAFALARPDALALERDHLHAPAQIAFLEKRHRQRDHGRCGGDGRKRPRHELGVRQIGVEQVDDHR